MSPIILFPQSTFAQDLPTSVNIKPSLTLTIPENSISLVLDPASNTFASQAIHITVGTNNEKGYKLLLSTPDNNTELVNTVDSSKTIPTLPTKEGGYTESDFTVNKWGYKLGSGNYIPYVPNATIMENSTKANNDTTTLTFASKIDYVKPSGTYSTTLSFKTIPIVTQKYMQEIEATDCTETPTVVIDKRDEQAYTIRRIADTGCWMIQNLNFTGTPSDPEGTITLDSTTSNIESTYTPSNPKVYTYQDLTTGDGDALHEAKIHISGNFTFGTWYNYVAAAAGDPITNTNVNTVYDICPASWRLPTLENFQSILSYVTEFNPVVMGNWWSGQLGNSDAGTWWWSSTIKPDSYDHYPLSYHKSNNGLSIAGYGNAREGYPVRCILK